MKKTINGVQYEAEAVGVLSADEAWNVYELSNGAILKVKQVLQEVHILPTLKDSEGNPQYSVKSQTIISVTEK